ncbi:hypothetical protein WN51_05515 [Melipona quadrifasciata]|uniref:Uncharacterized protein n=1 Tax=Melipona quadrifasciata TaxID=166423 RepID=A0A0M8ZST4_9HYME|nr:hypothetical protein WN51_05515 [Melipona quadrifasciata]
MAPTFPNTCETRAREITQDGNGHPPFVPTLGLRFSEAEGRGTQRASALSFGLQRVRSAYKDDTSTQLCYVNATDSIGKRRCKAEAIPEKCGRLNRPFSLRMLRLCDIKFLVNTHVQNILKLPQLTSLLKTEIIESIYANWKKIYRARGDGSLLQRIVIIINDKIFDSEVLHSLLFCTREKKFLKLTSGQLYRSCHDISKSNCEYCQNIACNKIGTKTE